MATNKNAQLRYNILDECFANPYKKFFIEDLIGICSEKLSEYYGEEKTVSRRTILEDIVFMESADGFNAPIERIKEGKRVYFRYEEPNFSILKKELNTSDKEILTEMLSLFARLKNIENFEWVENLKTKIQSVIDINFQQQIIDFQDNNFLAGLEYLNPLYHYIANQQSLSIIYKPFTENTKIVVISPYYLKQYNNRWFLFGHNHDTDRLENLALDRITIIEPKNIAYKESEIHFEEYFDDIIGVTNFADREVEEIVLELSDNIIPYIATKPLHSSQKLKGNILKIKVKINYELESLILSYAENIKVITPLSLRNSIKDRLQKSVNRYDTKEVTK